MSDADLSISDALSTFLQELSEEHAASLLALDVEMHKNGKAKDAPVRELMGLIGDKWSHLILLILSAGSLGHAQLKRAIEVLSIEETISQRILTLKLRALERNGIVSRTVSNDIPPRVDYALSELGQQLTAQTRSLVNWIEAQNSNILAARRSFDNDS